MGAIFKAIGMGIKKVVTNPAVIDGLIAGVAFEVVTIVIDGVKYLVVKKKGIGDGYSDDVLKVFEVEE